jgi:hypothetical protein
MEELGNIEALDKVVAPANSPIINAAKAKELSEDAQLGIITADEARNLTKSCLRTDIGSIFTLIKEACEVGEEQVTYERSGKPSKPVESLLVSKGFKIVSNPTTRPVRAAYTLDISWA